MDLLEEMGGTLSIQDLCFIPAVSALDVQGSNDGDYMFDNVNVTIDESLSRPSLRFRAEEVPVPGEGLISFKVNNNKHVTMNTNNISLLISELIGNGDLIVHDPVTGFTSDLPTSSYNYGDSGNANTIINSNYIFGSTGGIIPSYLIIENGIELSVNKAGRISYVSNIDNPINKEGTNFKADIKLVTCGVGLGIIVKDNGIFSIGDHSVSNTADVTMFSNTAMTFREKGFGIIDQGSSLRVKGNAMVTLKGGSHFEMADRSKLIVEENGVLEIETGANLIIKGSGEILIKEGGQLIIHDGADIILESPMGNSSDFASRIVVNGNLEAADGKIYIQGEGVMVFKKDNQVTSGTSFLELRGHGLEHPAYQVLGPVNLNNLDVRILAAHVRYQHNINIRLGSLLVEKTRHTVPQLLTGYGAIAQIGNIRCSLIKSVTLVQSTFKDVGIEARYTKPGLPLSGSFMASRCTSETQHNDINFDIYGAYDVLFENCEIRTERPIHNTYENEYLNADLKKVGVQVERGGLCQMDAVIISGYGYDSGQIVGQRGMTTVRTEDADFYPKGIGIDQLQWLTLNFTTVEDSYFAIESKSDYNLRMDFSTLRDNHIGMKSYSKSQGLVKMICSRLENNDIGVEGVDVTLAIDGLINAQTTDGAIRRNYFENLNKHFNIRYASKDLPNEILARYNEWVEPEKYDIYKGNQNATLIQDYLGATCMVFNTPDCEDIAPEFPLKDPIVTDSTLYKGFIVDETTCEGYNVLEKYWRGYNCLMNGEWESSLEHFNDLSSIYYTMGTSSISTEMDQIIKEVVNTTQISYIDSILVSDTSLDTIYNFEIFANCESVVSYDDLKLYFLLDASSSVSSSEWSDMVSSVQNTLRQLSDDGFDYTYSVAQFAASGSFEMSIAGSMNLSDVDDMNRAFSGGTSVSYGMEQLFPSLVSEAHVILLTDAVASQFNVPPFTIYDKVKSSAATVTVVRYQSGSASQDDVANSICATIASTGGNYEGDLYPNPSDPDGTEKPRRFIPSSFSGSIPGLSTTITDCYELSILDNELLTNNTHYWIASDGGQIISDSINVTTITTNGVGTYTLVIVLGNGCKYTNTYSYGVYNSGPIYPISTRQRSHNGSMYWPHELEGMLTDVESEIKKESIIYPNPTSDRLFVTIEGRGAIGYEIIDMNGKILMSGKVGESRHSIDIHSLVSGVYMINLSLDDHTAHKEKFIKI